MSAEAMPPRRPPPRRTEAPNTEKEPTVSAVFIGILLVLLAPFAGPYRVLAWKSGGTGVMAWAGVVAYPACVFSLTPYSLAAATGLFWSWLGLIAWGCVTAAARWRTPRPDRGASHAWAGGWELAFALGLGLLAGRVTGFGGCVFFLTGYFASAASVCLTRLRRGAVVWTKDDSRRVLTPLYVFAPLTMTCLRAVGARLRPKPVEGGYRPPTFAGRVMSVVVGHIVLSALTGVISLWGLFKYCGTVLALICAITLKMLGGRGTCPGLRRRRRAASSPAPRKRSRTSGSRRPTSCATRRRRRRGG